MPDTKVSALTAVTAATLAQEVPVNDAGTSKRLTLAMMGELFFDRVIGASVLAGDFLTLQRLTANAPAITTVAPVVVMTTTGVGPGTWKFKYNIVYQSAALTTGIGVAVNHTGTTGRFVLTSSFASTGGAAATGIADQITAVALPQMVEARAERVKNVLTGATQGVDTINADCLIVAEGLIVVTTTGQLELKIGSEVAGSAITIQADTCLELTRVG